MKSVKIGNQEWSTNNLCVTNFRNGDPIQEVKNYDDWMNAYNTNNPARMSYRKSKKKGETYGFFYNWHAIIDMRGLAPIGYKIPSKNDWDELVNFIGEEKAGEKLKSDTLWKPSSWGEKGTNDYGFNALPGGSISVLDTRLTFQDEGKMCVFASNSEDFITQSIFKSETKEWIDIVGTEAKIATRILWNIKDDFSPSCSDKNGGYYVRCLVEN